MGGGNLLADNFIVFFEWVEGVEINNHVWKITDPDGLHIAFRGTIFEVSSEQFKKKYPHYNIIF